MEAKVIDFLSKFDAADVRICKDKFGKTVLLVHEEPNEAEDRKYYRISMIDADTLTRFGEVQFNYFYNNLKHVYLHNIMVNKAEDLGRGVGYFANKYFLETVHARRFDYIEGKWYPKEPATREQVDAFYVKNGYDLPDGKDYEKIVSRRISDAEIAQIKAETTVNQYGYPEYPALIKQNHVTKKEDGMQP